MKIVTRYNYVYLDPTSPAKIETERICFLFAPLYVGKGKEDRCLHGKIALEEGKQLLTNRLLYVDLKRLQRRGFDPEILKFNDEVTNEEALDVEGKIISVLGRRGIDADGILCNRALGGETPDTTGLPPPTKGKKIKDFMTQDRYERYRVVMSRPKTDVAMKKMVSTRKSNGTYTTGSAHPRAKKFVLISPSAERFEVVGALKKFCEEQDLSWQTLFNNQNLGKIEVDRSKYKNTKRLSNRFWNTVGWECQTA
jgi:hypothetical protein